jgi:CheY-specific phosphatase CheX
MVDNAKLVSKVLVLDHSPECYETIKSFCDANDLVGLKVQEDNVMTVLKSNVDLGAILLSEKFFGYAHGGLALAYEMHQIRPELPIFLRREYVDDLEDLSETDKKSFTVAYTIKTIDKLRKYIDECIFCVMYPNALVRGITELTKMSLESQLKGVNIEIDTPYIVRDRIIFGEIFTLIPLESSWCRGYMMLQTQEQSLLDLIKNDKTHVNPDDADDFRNVNNVLGEVTNLIWGAFKNRFISYTKSNINMAQVPLVINHQHRYISFGSENPQLCFRYRMVDTDQGVTKTYLLYQRFVFNLNFSPEDFTENEGVMDDLMNSGELELF